LEKCRPLGVRIDFIELFRLLVDELGELLPGVLVEAVVKVVGLVLGLLPGLLVEAVQVQLKDFGDLEGSAVR